MLNNHILISHFLSLFNFRGTSGIDIDLRRVDIDQCPQRNIPGSTKPLNIFAGTDKCKQRTTMVGFNLGQAKGKIAQNKKKATTTTNSNGM